MGVEGRRRKKDRSPSQVPNPLHQVICTPHYRSSTLLQWSRCKRRDDMLCTCFPAPAPPLSHLSHLFSHQSTYENNESTFAGLALIASRCPYRVYIHPSSRPSRGILLV